MPIAEMSLAQAFITPGYLPKAAATFHQNMHTTISYDLSRCRW